MTKELILMRHGKSDWSVPMSDFQRPLKSRGQREAQRIGEWLAAEQLVPDHILSSPAQRARETACAAADAMGFPRERIRWDESLYMADVDELLDAMAIVPDTCERLMLVGHNPGMEDLLFYLTQDLEIPADGKVLPTATIALLTHELEWADLEHACAEVKVLVRGKFI